MIQQFEIHGGVKKKLQAYLDEQGMDLKTAMDNVGNGLVDWLFSTG